MYVPKLTRYLAFEQVFTIEQLGIRGVGRVFAYRG